MENLRKKAEEILLLQSREFGDKIDDIKKIVHELQVYQIELELQNREMQEATVKLNNAERKFFHLFYAAPIAYFLFDFKGVIIDCNLKAIELLSHAKEILMNKPMISYIAEGKKDEFYNYLDDIIKIQTRHIKEFSLFKPVNNIVYTEFNGVLIQQEYILAGVVDITEKKIKDRELIKTLHKAEESDKLKTYFLNTISHEIRTPLNSIVGYSHLMSQENISLEKRTKYCAAIDDGSSQLVKIIEDILIVTTLKAQSVTLENKKISVNTFLNQIETVNAERIQNRKLMFKITSLEPDQKILTDANILTNIFKRLVDNAFKYTKQGEIEIGSYIKNKNIIFYVKDSGCGISEEEQKKLFAPFVKINNEEFFASGLGLGLTIAKEYTEILSGNIWCEAKLNFGTTFFFMIPFNQ